jgi:amino acid adenylation domain-containing protein
VPLEPATLGSATPRSVRPLGVPAAWTGASSQRPYPAVRLDRLVERQAERTPEALAIRDGATVISYAQLMQHARRLAHLLRARDIARDDLVAVCIDRSIDLVISVLGVLQAGAAYVPIDPQGPAERRRFMLEDSQPRVILTNAAHAGSIPFTLRETVVVLDAIPAEPAAPAAAGAPLPPIGTPHDVAYVIYTSGSTGTPKGVVNQHDGVSNHLAWMAETFPLTTADCVLGKTAAVFDVSVWEWLWPLSQGACLVLAPPGAEKNPRDLLDLIESQGITNIHFVPTLLRLFLARPDLDRCQSLERVICSGEALTPELRDHFFERLPGPPMLIDLYGPTETGVHVTGWICRPGETGLVPIGHPLPNVRAYIVDEALNAVPEGVKGELLIGGVQVARGYLRRPELTRERFVPDPFVDDPAARCYRTGDCVSWRADGAIDFFGRYDSQVQLGGARVELGEIEAALRLHPAVADAVVMVRETDTSKRLVAYLRRAHVVADESDPSIESLRRVVADHLADYMTPTWYVWLDDFPVTSTGKVDRRALPSPDVARVPIEQAFEAPRAGTESRLAPIWCDKLQINRVGRHDEFHLLGGDSLVALLLGEAIMAEFHIDLSPGEILQSPTIAQLASRIDTGAARSRPTTSLVPLRAGSGQPALYLPFAMGGQLLFWREFVRALGPGRPVYGFRLPDGCEPSTDLRALAAAMVRDLLVFQPEGPYHLAGYSFSAALAFEMAQQLRASGRTVGVLAMIDYGPGEPPGWSARVRTAGDFIVNLPYWLRYDVLQAGWTPMAVRASRKVATLGDKILHIGRPDTARSAEWAVNEIFGHQQLPEAHRRLAIGHLDAYYRYQPEVYNGRILLFWARCRPLFHSLAPDLGWKRYAAGGFERVVVACNHDNILTLPHVSVIAAGIEKAIGELERRGGRSTPLR